jgi:hypothetical protein
MKQSAIEWFYIELKELIKKSELSEIKPSEFDNGVAKLLYQAKEIEKQHQGYSKKDMIEFANFKTSNLMKHSDSKGFYLGDEKVFNLWFEQFKNNDRKINNTKLSS